VPHNSTITCAMYMRNKFKMVNSHYGMCLQGIMIVVFIKTNIQSKMMKTTTVP